MKRKWLIPCIVVLFIIVMLFYNNIQKTHTFTLADSEHPLKSEQVQPLFGTVKVRGDCDTDVIFTDIETGEEYMIGYITSGISEKIKLQKGKWYTVTGGGNLTVGPVNVRVE